MFQLKPVKFLEGELIHDLLTIFVSEKLESYVKFYDSHKGFVDGLGLKHEDNLRKMKLLSFMQLAENRSEISFSEVQQEMQLGEDEGEGFIIDVLKTKLVKAKMSQGEKLVYVSSTMHRTFGPGHWQQLHSTLSLVSLNLLIRIYSGLNQKSFLFFQWKANLHTVRDQMQHVAQAQMDIMHKKI